MNMSKSESDNQIKHFKYEKQLILFLLFFLYSYSFSMEQSFYTTLSNRYDGKLPNSGISLLFYALGLFIFAVYLSFSHKDTPKMNFIMGIITLCTPPFLYLFFTVKKLSVIVVSIYFLMFIFGCQGVYIYKLMYDSVFRIKHIGKVYGLAVSCSILLQYFFQMKVNNPDIILSGLLIVAFFMAFMFFSGLTKKCEANEWDIDQNKSSDKTGQKRPGFVFIFSSIIIVLILLEFTGNFLSYPLLALMAQGKPFLYDTPRLFIILAYIFMGFLADIEEMKYIPAATFVGVLIGILNPVLLHDPTYIYLNTCIYYIVAGIINSFIALMMWKLAHNQKKAPLIAVSGRIIDSVFSFIFVSPVFSKLSLAVIIGLELVAIIIIMVLFALCGYFNFSTYEDVVMEHITPEEFARYFELSGKETEIFTAAVSHNGTMSELAKRLYISRSILYRNINNICEKTGQETFQAVKHLYYQMPVRKKISSQITEAEDILQEKAGQSDNTTVQEPIKEKVETDFDDKLSKFAESYALTAKECQVLRLFLENPDKTQKELADIQETTLRTVQRHLANIRTKTDVKSLVELSTLFNKWES